MRIDGPGCALPAHIAGEGHPHPPSWWFCEERPRERRHLRPVRPTGSARRWPLHPRSRRPATPRGSAQHQPHGGILHTNQVNRHQSGWSDHLRTAWSGIEARNCTRSRESAWTKRSLNASNLIRLLQKDEDKKMHHETSRNGMKLNESDQGAIGLRQGPGVSGPTGNRRVASVPWRAARGRAPRTAQG